MSKETNFDRGWNMAESFDQYRKEREGITECRITVNGQPLEEFVAEQTGLEIAGIRIEIVGRLSKTVAKVNAPKTKRKRNWKWQRLRESGSQEGSHLQPGGD